MAMLLGIANLASELRLELIVGTVDHGLRSEAMAETQWVVAAAEQLGLRCEIAKLTPGDAYVGRIGGSLQEWARQRRYEVLGEMARRDGCRFLATAHTSDDQAETVLLRLLRGTGIEGLSGISSLRPLDEQGDIQLVRPLLHVSRAGVENYLQGLGVSWLNDPSNRDPRFARVRVRNEVLPALDQLAPGVACRLAALAEEAAAVQRFLEAQLEHSEGLIRNVRLSGGVKVDRASLESVPRSLWGNVLRLALKRVRGDLRRIGRAHIEPIEQLVLQRKSTGSLPLPGDASVCLDQGDAFFFPGPLPSPPTGSGQPSPMGAGKWRLRFVALGALAEVSCQRPDIALDLEVRARRNGDRLYGSRTKLKELLIKRKVPRPYRDFIPVLAYGDQVIAAPAILSSRMEALKVSWLLESSSPALDLGFGP
jgi:tRNA(Ile)-lysidine synthase